MKKIIAVLLVCLTTPLMAQKLHYFRVNLSPKFENYTVTGNENVNALFHMDVGASVLVGKRFTPNWYGELGLLKNDYSAKLDILTQNNLGADYRWFDEDLYPTFTSSQLLLNGGYRHAHSQLVSFYGGVGLQIFLSKKLSRDGTQLHIRESVIEVDGVREQIAINTFSNGLEAGNFLVRADAGIFLKVSKSLSVDLGVTARTSTNSLNEFEIEYSSTSQPEKQRAVIATSGAGLSLNIGFKYQIAAFE